MRWVVTKQHSDYMRKRVRENEVMSYANRTENAVAKILGENSSMIWRRQKQWGVRIFDFWCHQKGVAIEMDGPEHNEAYDRKRDEYVLGRSAIIVIRFKNHDLAGVLKRCADIDQMPDWHTRRVERGLYARGKGSKRARLERLKQDGVTLAHGNWTPIDAPEHAQGVLAIASTSRGKFR